MQIMYLFGIKLYSYIISTFTVCLIYADVPSYLAVAAILYTLI